MFLNIYINQTMSGRNSSHTNREARKYNATQHTKGDAQFSVFRQKHKYHTNKISGTRVFVSSQPAGVHGGILYRLEKHPLTPHCKRCVYSEVSGGAMTDVVPFKGSK